MKIIRSDERYAVQQDWLNTRFSFSFADYYDPENLQFGSLRVFNDDRIAGGGGFGMHPHANMEIVTYVIDGVLEHRDSMGNSGLIHPGEVQHMTAGTGIRHSEMNPSPDQEVHLLQLWFIPRSRGLAPAWEQKQFSKEQQWNVLYPVVSNRRDQYPESLGIEQDVTMYLSRLQSGKSISYQQSDPGKMYVFVIDGALRLNGEHLLEAGDSARIDEVSELQFINDGDKDNNFMLIDMGL
ncbi:MAG: yhhW 2 [Paenibacillaceae bacterium]|jgi:redox-sensitive bicupin YhaK (pirin superfamily)|nr:yhhW 2 [Paenibacillaceae bacterium]